jgi:DNA adenine methylase
MINSPLKWLGGKRKIVPVIAEIWKDHKEKRWVDLFAGGCSIPLNIQPNNTLINDINPDLINFWKWVQNNGIPDISKYINQEEYYYTIRDEFNKSRDPALFHYLNKTCYRGVVRYNNSNENNVGFGHYTNVTYITDFSLYRNIVKNWNFSNCHYKDIELNSNDFIFADPPYDSGFTKYTKDCFSWEDQVELAEKLSKHKGIVIATNKATDRIISLYSNLGFDVKYVLMSRMISSDGNRDKVKEIFATKGLI